MRFCTLFLVACATVTAAPPQASLTEREKALIQHVTADSLKADVSFLASDELEGRDTPSRGQDVAAAYVASRFRAAGLEPAGDDGFYQLAPSAKVISNKEGIKLELNGDAKPITLTPAQVSVFADHAADGARLNVFHYKFSEEKAPLPTKEQVKDKVLLVTDIAIRSMSAYQRRRSLLGLGANLVIFTGDPRMASERLVAQDQLNSNSSVAVRISDQETVALLAKLPAGDLKWTATFHIPGPKVEKFNLKNVVGVLRGWDATLRDTYVLVSAHYDHIGTEPDAKGDTIYNGANDDASGTAGLVETAWALGHSAQRPKRSVIFAAWFGEEKGLLGSQYYGRHPRFPLAKTVADLNLEQIGRTDDNEGDRHKKATLTGYDFTSLGPLFVEAGKATGVHVWKHEKYSDLFFNRSDNQALADAGVPATTLCVAFEYPDYHGLGDHWDKIDYANMELVVRLVSVAVDRMANLEQAPHWNRANPKTAEYVKAWEKLQAAK